MSEQLTLAINAGSTSLKFGVYAAHARGPIERARGAIDREQGHVQIKAKTPDGRVLVGPALPDDAPAGGTHERVWASLLLDWLSTAFPDDTLLGVGHRVVHGGERLRKSTRVSASVLDELDRLTLYAPLHQPANLAAIREIAQLRPELPQVACFDTAFHLSQDRLARRYALPAKWDDAGIRRFGFHGLSFRYVMRWLERRTGTVRGRTVVAHLGGGASVCGLIDGTSAASSMGLTPLDGLPMATRCGEIDPGALLVMLADPAMTPTRLRDLLYRESGLLGVSGISGDVRVLLASSEASAADAIALFVRRTAREIAAIAGEIGGIDRLIFTGGIGENAPTIRARIVDALDWLGLQLSGVANDAARLEDTCISASDSAIACWVVATDEESIIASDTLGLLCGV